MKLNEINKILIIKPSSLGDIIHSLPTLVELRKLYPESYIAWVIFTHFAEILYGNQYLNEIILWNRYSGPIEFINMMKYIRDKHFDLVIDLQGLARTALISFYSGAKYKLGVPGLKELSYLFIKEVGPYSKSQHAIERNLTIIRFLGYEPNSKLFPINISPGDEQYAKSFLSKNRYNFKKNLVGISPSAGIKQKMWEPEKFASIANKLIETYDCYIIIFGTEKDINIAEKIIELIRNKNNVINAINKTSLKQLCALIKFCSIFIGNDTGPLHIAAALNVPTIGLYGPSNPEQLGPYNKNSTFIWKKLECSPCGTKPNCKNNICMKQITVEEVYEKIKNISHWT